MLGDADGGSPPLGPCPRGDSWEGCSTGSGLAVREAGSRISAPGGCNPNPPNDYAETETGLAIRVRSRRAWEGRERDLHRGAERQGVGETVNTRRQAAYEIDRLRVGRRPQKMRRVRRWREREEGGRQEALWSLQELPHQGEGLHPSRPPARPAPGSRGEVSRAAPGVRSWRIPGSLALAKRLVRGSVGRSVGWGRGSQAMWFHLTLARLPGVGLGPGPGLGLGWARLGPSFAERGEREGVREGRPGVIRKKWSEGGGQGE